MAKSKKYYWLKLKNDFFKRHDVRIVEAMPNGKDYVLFYLKLLVESVSHDGMLRFSDTIPYNEDMLATITNTNVDIVRSAIKVFTELSLMETMDDQTIYMVEVNKMTGSETEWAEKKRIQRQSKGTLSLKSPDEVRQEKETELEKEKEQETKELVIYYQKNISGNMSPIVAEALIDWLNTFDSEMIKEAINKGAKANKHNWNYIHAILNNWESEGKKSLMDLEEKSPQLNSGMSKAEMEEAVRNAWGE